MLTRSLTIPQSRTARTGDIPCDPGLFDRLRMLRKELADAKNVPPYVVFSDVTLRHFCRDYPQNDAALLRAPGVGEKKLDDYGRAFIDVIRDWLSENERLEFSPLQAAAPLPPRSAGITTGTAAITLEQFRAGRSIAEIAQSRSMVESTIENHLAQAIENGERLDPRGFYTADEERQMQAALEGYDEPALKPVFEQLEGHISYGKLRLYRAVNATLAVVD